MAPNGIIYSYHKKAKKKQVECVDACFRFTFLGFGSCLFSLFNDCVSAGSEIGFRFSEYALKDLETAKGLGKLDYFTLVVVVHKVI